VTNTSSQGCESFPDTSRLFLRQKPEPPVVADVVACTEPRVPTLVASGENVKWYLDMPDGPLVDPRDGKEYETVNIGKQVWMAENLDAGAWIVGGQEQTDNGIIEKYHYYNDHSMGEIYGGLYQWSELMNYDTVENARGICPDGWEIPSNRDWMKLEITLGMGQAEATLYEWRGTDQGARLKEGGSSGFNAQMGGKRTPDGQFQSEYYYGTYWNSSGYNRTFMREGNYRDQVYCSRFDLHENGFSVRCMMNDSAYTVKGNELALPDHLPGIYTFDVTQTVDGCESDYAVATITIKESPGPPQGTDVTVCEGEAVPPLEASGEGVKWYANEGLTGLAGTGNQLHTGQTQAGTYTYYATQSTADCESEAVAVALHIKPLPVPPAMADTGICEGKAVPDLVASGEHIRWYQDSALQQFLFSGPAYTTGQTMAGTGTYFATQTVSGCESRAARSTLAIYPVPLPPVTTDLEGCEGGPVPDLRTEGEEIKWYEDMDLSNLLCSGDTFTTGLTDPGTYRFYATETEEGCESQPAEVSLAIYPFPPAPGTVDVTVCEGEPVPPMMATGDSVRWYEDQGCSIEINSGNLYDPPYSVPGIYPVYVTQTEHGCEGPAGVATLTIREGPEIDLGNDTLIYTDQVLILGPFPVKYGYLWNDGSDEAYLIMNGKDYEAGVYEISVQVSHEGCFFSDTVLVTVENVIGTGALQVNGSIAVFPNPTDGAFIIEFRERISDDILVEVFNSNGIMVRQYRYRELPAHVSRSFRIQLETAGIYFMRIIVKGEVSGFRLIKL
jgi:uncharacterized protein (TIGR02145 family)